MRTICIALALAIPVLLGGHGTRGEEETSSAPAFSLPAYQFTGGVMVSLSQAQLPGTGKAATPGSPLSITVDRPSVMVEYGDAYRNLVRVQAGESFRLRDPNNANVLILTATAPGTIAIRVGGGTLTAVVPAPKGMAPPVARGGD